jgi:hypothetical protein
LTETEPSQLDDNLSKCKFPAIVGREVEHILSFIVKKKKQWNYHNYVDYR